jgi:predicted phage terminase large subunit-like protein
MSQTLADDGHVQEAARLLRQFRETVLDNPYIPVKLFPKQVAFLMHSDVLEVLYGGAANSGKTFALLAVAAQFVQVPGYEAIIFRNTEGDLKQAKGLIATSHEWWASRKDMQKAWNGNDLVWTFPSGAKVRFDYMNSEEHAARHRGSSYQTIIWDEVTLQEEDHYTFLFRSLRKPISGPLSKIPLRVRSSTNPGGIGHVFVRERFIPDDYLEEPDEDKRFSRLWWKRDSETGELRLFVPARFKDNIFIDQEAYMRSLMEMNPVDRARQMHGDWRDFSGGQFQKEWFTRRWWKHGDYYYTTGGNPRGWHKSQLNFFAAVDSAISEKSRSDFTAAGAFAACPDDDLLVLKVKRAKMLPLQVVAEIAALCKDTGCTKVGFESDNYQRLLADAARKYPGMPTVIPLYTRNVGKLNRALPAIGLASRGKIVLPEVQQPWSRAVLTEWLAFTGDPKKDLHDDAIDMLAWAVHMQKTAGPKFAGAAEMADAVPVPETRRLEDRSRDRDSHTKRGHYGRH